MKHIILLTLAVIYSIHLASANIYITEVMHSPNQVSQADGEWLELYNDGSENIDLSTWTINGKDFENVTIEPEEFLVVARELVDGDDEDTESFVSYWVISDYKAVDGSFSLKSEDTIVLTNGVYTETVTYNETFGGENGHSIERVSLTEWTEGPIDGTPGNGEFSTATGDGIDIYLIVLNNVPTIHWVNFTVDDSVQNGTQVLPKAGGVRSIPIAVLVSGNNIEKVYSDFNGMLDFSIKEVINDTSAVYVGEIYLDYDLNPGEYNLDVFAVGSRTSNVSVRFDYLRLIATELNVEDFDLSLEPGESVTKNVAVKNIGNVAIDTEVESTGFVSTTSVISEDVLEIFSGGWYTIGDTIPTQLEPGESVNLSLKVTLPKDSEVGSYKGKVAIKSKESV